MAKRRVTPSYLKPRRGLGDAIQTERRRHARDIRKYRDRRLDEERNNARRFMLAREKSSKDGAKKADFGQYVMSSIAVNQRAFANSLGINIPIIAETWWGSTVAAYTDWEQVICRYPTAILPEENDNEGWLRAITDVRGIIQHELGHIRFTIPLKNLVIAAGANRELIGENPHFHKVWNILEDQRMESRVVQEVPRIANYFKVMVGTHVVNQSNPEISWLLLAGREYFDKTTRSEFAAEFDRSIKEGAAERWYEIVKEYKEATTEKAMVETVFIAIAALLEWKIIDKVSSVSEHEGVNSYRSPTPKAGPEDGASDSNPFDDSVDTYSDESEGDGSESGAGGGEGEEQPSSTASYGNGAGAATNKLKQQVQSITEQLHGSDDTKNILANARAKQSAHGGSLMVELAQSGVDMPPADIAIAESVSVGIQNALVDFETQSQPAWMSRQDTGVLDAFAYRTRPTGSRDYNRRLDGDYTTGLDLHVSVLCDISGSMHGEPMRQLSIAVYGFALACKQLGIDTNFLLWSTEGNEGEIWVDSAPTPTLWSASGGTNPTVALDAMTEHNKKDRSAHLVYIFTDGDWNQGVPKLVTWAEPGRYIVVNQLNDPHRRPYMDGADHFATIKDVSEIPGKLAEAINWVLN